MRVRREAVAGYFYPASRHELARMVDGFLHAAEATGDTPPAALIAPHAGYVYSGPTAGVAYRQWQGRSFRRIVLLGPPHRVYVAGLGLSSAAWWQTPLGRVPVDQTAMQTLAEHPLAAWRDDAHAPEHSLEVQLPFLQRALAGEFAIVPVLVGEAAPQAVAEALALVAEDPETAIVISSDLSHYLPYEAARAKDEQTLARITSLTPAIDWDEACGAGGINGLLAYARAHGWQARLLDYRNSGDTAGDRLRVVGYGAVGFWHEASA